MVATPLIERISKLDAPDREVDAEIAMHLLGYTRVNRMEKWPEAKPIWDFYEGEPLNSNGVLIPKYTASVDAAIALAERVLPGWGFFLRSDKDGHNCGMVYPVHNFVTPGTESGATPAISMCIAILRATEAGQP